MHFVRCYLNVRVYSYYSDLFWSTLTSSPRSDCSRDGRRLACWPLPDPLCPQWASVADHCILSKLPTTQLQCALSTALRVATAGQSHLALRLKSVCQLWLPLLLCQTHF